MPYRDKVQQREYQKHWTRERARELDALKDVPCFDCGVRYPPYVMDFDHRNPEEKFSGLNLMKTYSRTKVLEEIAKCDVVCANCHRERTNARRN